MSEESPSSTLLRLVQGSWVTQALHVAAALGIADELRDGPATSERLAAATGAHHDALHRLLRYLVSLGVLDGDDDGGFRLTPVGELLRTDVPGSERERAITYGTWNYEAFAGLLHTIRTGEPAFHHVFGMSPYGYLAQHPEKARFFDRQMARNEHIFAKVPDVYDFSGTRKVVDVAGGNGALLSVILAAAPHARGVLFDAEHVVEAARDRLRERGVHDRCELAGGNFLDWVPAGGDVYILSRVLHNWSDDDCRTLLTNCRKAMPAGARLLILEHLLPDDGPGELAVAFDINMMTLFNGRERTWAELDVLLAGTGFELLERHALQHDITMLTARRH